MDSNIVDFPSKAWVDAAVGFVQLHEDRRDCELRAVYVIVSIAKAIEEEGVELSTPVSCELLASLASSWR